ncbi:MAG: hypothetical protein JO270_17635 [Acidobacteriaceae bacterium]|nr:hypothetical protein [Acidobacteriaceae bacterium]
MALTRPSMILCGCGLLKRPSCVNGSPRLELQAQPNRLDAFLNIVYRD